VKIELPKWTSGSNLYIISRNELVAYKKAGSKEWKVKKKRCNKCGRCCTVHPKEGSYFPTKPDGSCIHLIDDGRYRICKLGMEKPLACVLGEPEGAEYEKFKCCIEYKTV